MDNFEETAHAVPMSFNICGYLLNLKHRFIRLMFLS